MGRPRKVINKGGRPTIFTPDKLQKLETAFRMGCNKTEAIAYAEISDSTFYDYIKRNPELSDKIKRWQQNPILKAKHTIFQNLDDPKTAQWYLEKKCIDFQNQIVNTNVVNINNQQSITEQEILKIVNQTKELADEG